MKSSRYNIFVPLRNGRMLAYNGFSGALAVWEKQEQETYQVLEYSPSADLDRLTKPLRY